MPVKSMDDRVYEMLSALKVDEVFDINEKVKPENRERFIETVKRYIYEADYNVEFNNTYDKLRRIGTQLKPVR